VLKDAEIVYDFINQVLNISENNIILLGRSIGTGPVTYLGRERNPGAIILISPFTSIKDVAKNMVGEFMSHVK
jgi:hypothetical protein